MRRPNVATIPQIGVDFINMGAGESHGDVADRLLESNLDVGVLRPFRERVSTRFRGNNPIGPSYIEVFNHETGKPQIYAVNSPALLMKEQWVQLDEAVVRAARPALRVWGDIVAEGLTYTIPNGMAVTTLQHQIMTDAGNATFSMDGLAEAGADRTVFDLLNLPLPLVHGDFAFSLRELSVARTQSLPLDTTMIEQVTRRCMEQVEALTIGVNPSYTYGGGTIYGVMNFPSAFSQNITAPTDAGWYPEIFINQMLNAIQTLANAWFHGPYGVWYSKGWTQYLDADYTQTYAQVTLRKRAQMMEDVKWWRKADFMTDYSVALVDLSPWTIQAVQGMKLQTLQWDSKGGLQKNFKVMAIMVPRVRKNAAGNCGIVAMTGV